jgi:putative oxidoreductase
MDRYGLFAGRLLLAAIFVLAGIGKLFTFEDTVRLLGDTGFAGATVLLVGVVAFELGGGVLLGVGHRTREVGLALAGYVVFVTLVMHHDLGNRLDATFAFSNLGLVGGLVVLAAHGAGPFSADDRRRRQEEQMARGKWRPSHA